MVDLWGPGAFGALGAAPARPPYTPTNGGADPDTFMQDCSSPSAADGTEWRSAHLNALLVQMRSVARRSGVAISNLDDDLMTRAIRSQGANYRAAGGTANALTITLAPAVASISELVNVPLLIKAAAANTSAAVTLSVDGLTGVPVKRLGGGALNSGDLQPGFFYEIVYDGTQFQIISPIAAPAGASTTRAPRLALFAVTGSGAVTSIPSSVVTIIPMGAIEQNNLGTSTWTSSNTLTIGSDEAGLWLLQATTHLAVGGGGAYSSCSIFVNGLEKVIGVNPQGSAGDGAAPGCSGLVKLSAGDTVTVRVYQQTGAAINTTGTDRTRFQAALISSY